jgi:SSS family solute:Na+ symporter
MHIFGLHILDISIVLAYVIVVLWLGHRVAKKTKNTDDFFLAGRKLGKFYQLFLNFGCSTNADQAVAVSREIYRQGIGGMWIQFLVLFLTPFYWFSTFFFRRVRLTTIGDYFTDRFRSEALGAGFAIFILLLSVIGGGVGYMVAAKTMMAMTPKAIEECTPAERQSIEEFKEYRILKDKKDEGFTEVELARYDVLEDKAKKNELKSFVSYTNPIIFYFIYALIVGIYTMLGGFEAAAITDAIQGILIIIFSAILIPVAMVKVGGFAGLHATVPDYMFELFGSATMSEYAWYTIGAMALANLVSIIAVAQGMQTAGSAKNEMTARIGMIGGMFAKRIIMIFWALAGLLAIAIYAGQLHDPDLIWGYMTKDLLVPGAIGLMLVGILAANMSSLDAGAVSYSALFIRNLYKPVFPDKSEQHYLFVGRIIIGVTLLGGIGVALFVNNLLELFKYMISVPAIFGASIWLGFVWRRLSKWAVIIQVVICTFIYAIIPNVFQELDAVKYNPYFLKETNRKVVEISTAATNEDVEENRATEAGVTITKQVTIEPFGIFFEQVVRENPDDPNSRLMGIGRFHAEIWMLSWFGFDFSDLSKAQLNTIRFLFDALFPFVLLFGLSFVTRPVRKEDLDRFFAKMHTPVGATPEEEEAGLQRSYANPEQFEKDKLFPGTQWEIMKWNKMDYIGFGGSWVLVGVVILLLWIVTNIK